MRYASYHERAPHAHADAAVCTYAGHFELYPGTRMFEQSLEPMKEFLLKRVPPV